MRSKLVILGGLLATPILCGMDTTVPPKQVVLQFVSQRPDGEIAVEPQARVGLFLKPVKPLHPAPLSPGALMICKPLVQRVGVRTIDGVDHGEFDEIGFKCGDDVYVFVALGLEEDKGETKNSFLYRPRVVDGR